MPDHHHRLTIETGQTAHDGVVIGKGTIAMQLFKIGEDVLDVIQRVGALRMARHLRNLPGRQLGVDILG